MADGKDETEASLDERLAVVLPRLSEACLGRRVERGEMKAVDTGTVDLSAMSLEEVVALACEKLAPEIRAVIAAVGDLLGASVIVRLELPCKERLPDGNGGSTRMSMTLPFGTLANTASKRMHRAFKFSLADDPQDEMHRAHGHMLRAFELEGEIRWASEAHRARVIKARPMIGVGMADVDSQVELKQRVHAATHGTVD